MGFTNTETLFSNIHFFPNIQFIIFTFICNTEMLNELFAAKYNTDENRIFHVVFLVGLQLIELTSRKCCGLAKVFASQTLILIQAEVDSQICIHF